jgi:ABC-2 type transport system permease protein
VTAAAHPLPRATGALSGARPSFPGAVRSELLKIGRQALTWGLVAGFAAVTAIALVSVLSSDAARRQLEANPATFYFAYLTAAQQVFTTGTGTLLLLTGSRLVAMEYGSGTIRVVLARGTGRLGLLAAQYTALAIVGVLLLVGFALVTAGFLYAVVAAWHGSFAPIASLPAVAWADTWRCVLVAAVSMAVCILLGTTAAAVGRSMAFGVGAALAFFPADNIGTIVLGLLSRLTHQEFWQNLTQWFLGPTLNRLPAALQTDHPVNAAFTLPLVPGLDATHCWLVIAAYSLVLLTVAVVLTWRRDVLH